MGNLEKTIREIQSDLTPLQITRDEYLAYYVTQRLEDRSKKYNEDFDKFIKKLEEVELTQTDISSLSKSLKKYSKSMSALYNSLLKEIQILNNIKKN